MAPGSYLVISAGHQENYQVREQVSRGRASDRGSRKDHPRR
jgi:hypothetical protein